MKTVALFRASYKFSFIFFLFNKTEQKTDVQEKERSALVENEEEVLSNENL